MDTPAFLAISLMLATASHSNRLAYHFIVSFCLNRFDTGSPFPCTTALSYRLKFISTNGTDLFLKKKRTAGQRICCPGSAPHLYRFTKAGCRSWAVLTAWTAAGPSFEMDPCASFFKLLLGVILDRNLKACLVPCQVGCFQHNPVFPAGQGQLMVELAVHDFYCKRLSAI